MGISQTYTTPSPVTKPHQTAKQGTRFTVTSRNTTMVEVTTTTIVAASLDFSSSSISSLSSTFGEIGE